MQSSASSFVSPMSNKPFANLSRNDILHITRQYIVIPRGISSKSRAVILNYIDEQENSAQVRLALFSASEEKETSSNSHKQPAGSQSSETDADLAAANWALPHRRIDKFDTVLHREQYENTKYLDLPSWSDVEQSYCEFYNATSNAAVCLTVCAVCAREVGQTEENLVVFALNDLPNAQQLCPSLKHAAHELFDGKLLEPMGVSVDESGVYRVNICSSCITSLSKATPNSPPPFSLANNMWIGKIPMELSTLTFPEQLLIAHLYPRVYVFKLFPKNAAGIDPNKLQRAMGGTVTTFNLDLSGTVSMLEGNLMPRPPSLLASLISVTFIGIGQLPKSWLRQFFCVRCQKVHAALYWLKKNNAKYYGNVTIDPDRLAQLPENDVPPEVVSIVRQSTDTGMVDQESAGYVPVEKGDQDGLMSQTDLSQDMTHTSLIQGPSVSENQYSTESEEVHPRGTYRWHSETVECLIVKIIDDGQADVIPSLYVNGAIDTDLSSLSAEELLKWGLVNLWAEGKEGSYAVRHGSQPVNDFGHPKQGEPVDPDRFNFFEQAYLCLYPFGCGGIEGNQPVQVGFNEHVQWALQYHDRRFRRHETQ